MKIPKNTLLIKNASYVVTCDGEDRLLENTNIYCHDGFIVSMGEEAPLAERTLDAKGMVVYPGLVNTHHHLYQILTRNLPGVQNLELFDWLRALYGIWRNLDAEAVYHSSMAGMAELLKSGCTTVFDHHYVFPHGTTGILAAQFAAAEQLGVRFVASRGSMSLGESDGGLPPDSVVQTVDEILQGSVDAVTQFHNAERGSMNQIVLAPCSPFSVSEDLMRESAILARQLGVRLHTHLAETLDEERFVLEKTGKRPLAYMESLGWTGPDVWFAHGIHFNDAELRFLAETGTGVAHCPASNMKLASGVCRVPDMLRLGAPLGLAVDGSASNDGSTLQQEMRFAYLLHRLNSKHNAPTGYDILKIATRGGAKLLGRKELGHLAPGMAADMFAVRLNRLDTAGAAFDVKSMLATTGLSAPVDATVVNGRIVVQEGRLCTAPEDTLSENASHAAARMQG